MSNVKFTVKYDSKKVSRALGKIKKQLKDNKKVLNTIGDNEIEKAQIRVRSSKVDPDGSSWAPWSYATLRQRLREGDAARGLLYKSGLLLKSFTKKLSRNKLTVSNDAPHAEYLQNGTPKMPKREFLGWSRQSVKELESTIKKWISDGWK